MTNKTTLYSKATSGKIRVWSVWTEGSGVVVEHGQKGGKLTQSRYSAEATNVGRSNERSSEQQSSFEMEALITKQLKTGYYKTEEEAENHVSFFPMKAQNYVDQSHKVVYPCYVEIKLDGQRMMIDGQGNALSKQGEPLQFPEHWVGVQELAKKYGGLDGEIYAGLPSNGGLILQDIISAFRKKNKNTEKLRYWVYDIPNPSLTMVERVAILQDLALFVKNNNIDYVEVVLPRIAYNETDGDAYFEEVVKLGYEGVMYRNFDGKYEFDKRSYDMIKRKKRETAEAVILSVEKDKKTGGVVTAKLVNGEHKGNTFKCLFRKDASDVENLREFDVIIKHVGKTFTVEFEAYSAKGVPQKPTGLYFREVNENGDPLY